MRTKITKETYNKLSKDDKLRYVYIQTDPKFEKLILRARKNLGITPKDWENHSSNLYATDEDMIIFETNRKGKTVPYGNWAERKKIKEVFRKKAIREINGLLKKLQVLSPQWFSFLYMLVCYDKDNSFPDKYSFIPTEKDGVFHIVINEITSPNDLINWIKDNWKHFKDIAGSSIPSPIREVYKKKSDLPTYESLDRIIKIIKLKQAKEKSKDIASKIDKTERTDEFRVDKMYHIIRKQLQKLEKEAKEKQKLELSIFGK